MASPTNSLIGTVSGLIAYAVTAGAALAQTSSQHQDDDFAVLMLIMLVVLVGYVLPTIIVFFRQHPILNILAREPAEPITIMTPEALRLTHEPAADCARYDSLRRAL